MQKDSNGVQRKSEKNNLEISNYSDRGDGFKKHECTVTLRIQLGNSSITKELKHEHTNFPGGDRSDLDEIHCLTATKNQASLSACD